MGTVQNKIKRAKATKAKKQIPNTNAALSAFRAEPFVLEIGGEKFDAFVDMNALACLQEEAPKHGKTMNGILIAMQSLFRDENGEIMIRELSLFIWCIIQYGFDSPSEMPYREFTKKVNVFEIIHNHAEMLRKAVEGARDAIGNEEDIKNGDAPKTSKKKTTKKKQTGA